MAMKIATMVDFPAVLDLFPYCDGEAEGKE